MKSKRWWLEFGAACLIAGGLWVAQMTLDTGTWLSCHTTNAHTVACAIWLDLDE